MKYEPKLHKLSNGVTVILDSFESPLVNIDISFATGDEDDAHVGISHLGEHLLFRGNKEFPSAFDAITYVNKNQGTVNAFTDDGIVKIFGEIASENFDILLDVIGGMLPKNQFTKDVLEQERAAVLNEIRIDKNNRYLSDFYHNVAKHMFPGITPPWYRSGNDDNVASFTMKQLKMWMAGHFSASNCTVVISGNIPDETALLKKLDDKLSYLKPFNVAPSKNQSVNRYNPVVLHTPVSKSDNVNLSLYLGQKNPAVDDIYYKILVSVIKRKLRDVLRGKHGLVYDVDAYDAIGDLTQVSFDVAPEKLEQSVILMAQTMRDIRDGKIAISDDDIKSCTGPYILDMLRNTQSANWRTAWIIEQWNKSGRVFDLNAKLSELKSITADQVIQNTRGYFDRPISFVTHGADYNVDLRRVWNENFGVTNTPTITGKIIKQHKNNKGK